MFNLLAQSTSNEVVVVTYESSGFGLVFWLFYLAFIAVMIVAMWKVFEKAGQAGWKSIIPFYNTWVMFEIAGRPGWWLFLLFIPFVNFVIMIILALDMAKAFGKSAAFGIFGLWLFSVIGYLMLAFGDAKYQLGGSPTAAPAEPAQPAQ